MTTKIIPLLEDFLAKRGSDVDAWLKARFEETPALVYSSVDVRHSGLKMAPVDTNVFPAGFNNLSERAHDRAAAGFARHLKRAAPDARRLLLVPENHTRNLWYLENVRILSGLLSKAGYEVRLGSLMYDLDEALELETATGAKITIEPLEREGDRVHTRDGFAPDAIVVNNDMSTGAPSILVGLDQPVMPPVGFGWYRRRKSVHFSAYDHVVEAFSDQFGLDSWLLSTGWHQCGQINFRERAGLNCVARGVEKVLHLTREKYREYGFDEDPYVFVKADSGTYGMGVMTARSGDDIFDMNKKARHKMNVIKEGAPNTEVIVQEGVPTIDLVEGQSAEPVIYLVDGEAAGGFYRVNREAGEYDSLNARGAHFVSMCEEVSPAIEPNGGEANGGGRGCPFRALSLIGALAALSAARERSA